MEAVTFKLRYFPGDNCDIHALCKELIDAGLVKLYGDGLAYIPQFGKHQHVNPRESASILPEPKGSRVGTRHDASARVNSEIDPQVGRGGKGKEGKEEAKASSAFVAPEWVPAEQWASFVQTRKAMRNVPFTEAAAKGVVAELRKLAEAGHDPAEMLQNAVTNGWRTVYPPKNSAGTNVSTGETAYQRNMRERMEGFAPGIAARAPGQQRPITIIEEVPNVIAIAGR